MSSTVIETVDLKKSFGNLNALEDLSFKVQKGEIFGIAGPNGAGKSTLISILTTVLKPTSGDIFINGLSIRKDVPEIKKIIGYVPQETALYLQLSGLDNLKFWSSVYGLEGEVRNERIREAVEITQLGEN